MRKLEDRITGELAVLVGQPLGDCWRAVNMQIFEFGPRRRILNRKGIEVEVGQFKLHVQCRWRMVDRETILFGRDDLNYPADESISLDDFDWDQQDSVLDVKQRAWFAAHRDTPVHVVNVRGDDYGGFRIELERGVVLEAFPCDSRGGEEWRLLGHRHDKSHVVVTGHGIEGVDCEQVDNN